MDYQNLLEGSSCPNIRRTAVIDGQMKPFINNSDIKESISELNKLPHELLSRLSIAAIERDDIGYRIVENMNFVIVDNSSTLSTFINYLNSMIKGREECFDKFPTNVPTLILLRDEIHTSIVDSYVKEKEYIYGKCDSIVCSIDEIYKLIDNTPIFLFSKHVVKKDHTTFGNYYLESNKPLAIDPYTLVEDFRRIEEKVKKEDIVWEEKESKIYWRGQSGLSTQDLENCMEDAYNGKFTRLGLVLESINNFNLIDARFSKSGNDGSIIFTKCIEEIYERVEMNPQLIQHLFTTDPTSIEEHLKYKYLLSVDGWTSAWVRVPWILSSNSVLLKQKSTTVQWFYGEMQEDKHYIEVSENFSSLSSLLNLDDSVVKKIADAGKDLYLDLFSKSSVENVMYTIMSDYYDAYNYDLIPVYEEQTMAEDL